MLQHNPAAKAPQWLLNCSKPSVIRAHYVQVSWSEVFDFVRTSCGSAAGHLSPPRKKTSRPGKMGESSYFFPLPPGTESFTCEKSPRNLSLAFWRRSAFLEDDCPHIKRCQSRRKSSAVPFEDTKRGEIDLDFGPGSITVLEQTKLGLCFGAALLLMHS